MELHDAIAEYFKNNNTGIVAVYLFGSRASHRDRPGSDVDIAILFKSTDAEKVIAQGIENALVGLSRRLRADVHPVALNRAGEALLKQIFGKGVCILIADPKEHARFKMVALARIANFNYYRSKMSRGFIRRLKDSHKKKLHILGADASHLTAL